jgi:hypothetical protein
MGDEPPADPQGADASMSNTTTRFVANNEQMAADGKSIRLAPASANVPVMDQNCISMMDSIHWDEKGFQSEGVCDVTGSDTRAVVERYPVVTNPIEIRTVGDRQVVDSRLHPLGRRIHSTENGVMVDRFPVGARTVVEQQPIENAVDSRIIGSRHPGDKGAHIPERYAIEAVGIGERYHSDARSVGERQYLESRLAADYTGVADRYHVDATVLRARCPVDSRSPMVEPQTIAERYTADHRIMQGRHLVDSRPGDDGYRTLTEGCPVDSRRFHADSGLTDELQHGDGRNMEGRHCAEAMSAGDIFSVDPRYPVGISHSIEARALNERHAMEARNIGERYPLESRALVERCALGPRVSGDRYTVENALVGDRVVWTEEANNVR